MDDVITLRALAARVENEEPSEELRAAVLAAQMAAWVLHMGRWTTLGNNAVVLAVASPEPADSVCITVGMIREAAR